MRRATALAASLALLCLAGEPLLAGALAPKQSSLVTKLCGGGEVTIPLESDGDKAPHCPEGKACHAANCRKLFDPAQRQQSR